MRSWKSFHLTSIFIFLLLFAIGGCAVRPPVVDRPRLISRDELRVKLLTRAQHWQNFQARLHINAESSKGKFRRVRTVVLAIPPDLFRLEAFSLWGQTAGALVSDEGGSSLWIPSERIIFSSDRASTLIEYFIGVPIPLETLLYSLVATIPPDQLSGLDIQERDSALVAHSRDILKNWSFTWEFIPHSSALKAVEVHEGPWSYRITYEPPVGLDSWQVPDKISFVSSQWQMEVVVDQIEPAPDLQAASFRMSFPSGLRTVDLDRVQWKEKYP